MICRLGMPAAGLSLCCPLRKGRVALFLTAWAVQNLLWMLMFGRYTCRCSPSSIRSFCSCTQDNCSELMGGVVSVSANRPLDCSWVSTLACTGTQLLMIDSTSPCLQEVALSSLLIRVFVAFRRVGRETVCFRQIAMSSWALRLGSVCLSG